MTANPLPLIGRLAAVTFLAIALPGSSRAQNVVFRDTFVDGERSTQRLPDSVAWYHSGDPAMLLVQNRVLTWYPTTDPVIWAYFPKQSLAVGEALSFVMTYQYTGTWAPVGTLRIGFLNSNGTPPVTTDLRGGPTGAYSGFATLTQNTSSTPLLIMRRGGPGWSDANSPLITSLGSSSNPIWLFGGNGGGTQAPNQPNTLYTAVFLIMRSATQIGVSISYSGGNIATSNQYIVSYTGPMATGELPTEFDTIAIGSNTGHFSNDIRIQSAAVYHDAPPSFTTSPVSQTIAAGDTVVFRADATGMAPLTYKWQRDGVDLPGETNPTLVVSRAGAALNGSRYTCTVTNVLGSVKADAKLMVVTTTAAETGRLSNLSVRTNSGAGAQVLNVGVTVGGNGTTGKKPLLFRVTGPALAGFGVPGTMADPTLSVQPLGSTTVVAANDNWSGKADVTTSGTAVGAFPLTDPQSRDAAILASLDPGVYTALAGGANAGTGTVLAEIYDATGSAAFTAATPRLTNVSARAQVNTGDDVLITGFAITGTTAKTLLIRASGPALAKFGVPGTLADPNLELFVLGGAKVAENDNWAGTAAITYAAGAVGAFPITDSTSKDAAILVTLPPGAYTAKVTGVNNGTGVALVEVYEVP